MEYYEEL